MKYLLISGLLFLTSCTYSVALVNNSGKSSDVVDEASTPSTSISPTITIPVKAI